MALSETDDRCAGRKGLGPNDPNCPNREACQRYTDLRDRGSDYAWPKNISVYTHVCSDPELSQFVPVEVVGHERNSGAVPDMGESLEGFVLSGDVKASSMDESAGVAA